MSTKYGAYLLLGHLAICSVDCGIEHLLPVDVRVTLARSSIEAWLAEVILLAQMTSHIVGRRHLMLRWYAARHAPGTYGRSGCAYCSIVLSAASLVWMRFVSGHDVDEEVEHVRLGQGRCNIGALEGPPLVLLSVNPCAHSKFSDENIAAFGEQDRSLSRDHLNFWVCLHDLLDAC